MNYRPAPPRLFGRLPKQAYRWSAHGRWPSKVAGRKLRLKGSPIQWFIGLAERYELRQLPLDARIACAAAALPLIHRDPFDRVLVALARAHRLTVLTSDENIPKYPDVCTLW